MARRFVLRAAAALLALGFAAELQLLRAQTSLVDGLVIKVDEPAKKITIKHGPFKKFDMDEPMTMVYAVRDPAMLKLVKAGDRVKFDADRINGQFTITTIRKAR